MSELFKLVFLMGYFASEESALGSKVFLLRQGLTIADMARAMCPANRSEEAMRVMLSQMIHGSHFYPELAKRVEKRYGLKLERQAA